MSAVMRRRIGVVCLVIGGGFLAWFLFGYFCLAFLTSQLIDDMSAWLLLEGLMHALWSWPGLAGIALTVTGALMMRNKKTSAEFLSGNGSTHRNRK